MLAFEPELTRLVSALWHLNKSVTHPGMRRDLGHALTHNVPKYEMNRSAESRQAADELKRKGYQVLGECLTAAEIAEVRARLETCLLFDSEATNYQDGLVKKSDFKLKDRPAGVHLVRYKVEDVMRCAPLLRLACSHRIVAAAEAYIGCTPTISGFQVWHSFPGQADVPAEVFHRDRDCFSFVKLFAYLSDVDAAAGPHEFVQFSHSADALQNYFQARGMKVDLASLFEGNMRHLATADIQALLGPNIVRTNGPAGFGFLEDTFGLHRGTRPESLSRLIFSVTYAGLPLRFANENDRAYEMGRKISFAEVGLGGATELERYLLRFFLN